MAVRNPLKMAFQTLFCLLLIAGQTNARAEGFADLYLGTTGNWRADVGVSETRPSGTTSASATIDLPSPTEFGLRFGAWHPTYDYVGLGIDFGYAHADAPGVEITTFPMSILLALRAPLFQTPDRPQGRLQPYAMGGMSFYIADVSIRLNGMGGDSYQVSWPMPYATNTVNKVYGPYLAAGLAWQPTKRLAIFGEYRHTSFKVGYDTTNSLLFPTANGRVDTTVRSDRIIFGISHRFGTDTSGKEATQ
ncbi:MAG: outer membrane beta-barrel protein [Nitrospirae bacterium]|nr:outer membrane beta-barrel protein [Nitrospirota bacterium]